MKIAITTLQLANFDSLCEQVLAFTKSLVYAEQTLGMAGKREIFLYHVYILLGSITMKLVCILCKENTTIIAVCHTR